MDLDTFDLPALAAAADVSARTVRYYVQQGLIPAPESRGPGAHYTRDHLDRLRLIKRMQREHLPLAEIRRRLEAMTEEEIRRLADEPERSRGPGSALEYIRRAMSEPPGTMHATVASLRSPAADLLQESAGPPIISKAPSRAQYDRITLAPDVELHVRRPLSREQNRRVERLLQAARDIFEEDAP